ncbi:MAG: PDZ domain-containing protein [Planctomycetota bacterium]
MRRGSTLRLGLVLASLFVALPALAQDDADLRRALDRAVERRLEELRKELAHEVEQIVADRTKELRAENARLKRVIRELRGEHSGGGEHNEGVRERGGDAPEVATGDRAFLGVSMQQAPNELASSVDADTALIVVHVLEGTPAAGLGLSQGDLVTKIDGEPATEDQFLGTVRGREPGDKISLVFYKMGRRKPVRMEGRTSLASRNQFQKAIDALLAAREGGGEARPANPRPNPGAAPRAAEVGFTIEIVDQRAIVADVEPESNAAAAGLKSGDHLLQLDDQSIASLDDIRGVVRGWHVGDRVRFVSMRDETTNTAVMVLGGGSTPGQLLTMESHSSDHTMRGGGAVVERVPLGVTVEPDDRDRPVVAEVTPGSNAAIAGLQEGDTIVRVDGVRIADIDTLREALGAWRSGSKQSLAFRRDGRMTRVQMVVAGESGEPQLLSSESGRRGAGARGGAGNSPRGGRAYLGITPTAGDGGVEIARVAEGGPAAGMGLRAGDVITALNDTKVTDTNDLRRALRGLSAGDEVRITVNRDGATQTLEGKLGERSDGGRAQAGAARSGQEALAKAATPRAKGTLGVTAAEDGNRVVIDEVVAGGAAALAGVVAGDVIVRCSGSDVSGFETLRAALAAHHAGDKVELVVRRGGVEHRLSVELRAVNDTAAPAAEAAESATVIPEARPYVGFELEEHVGRGRVVVFEITNDSPAASAGFTSGDRIVSFAGTQVEDLEAVRDTLQSHNVGDSVDVEIERGDRRVTLRLILGSE